MKHALLCAAAVLDMINITSGHINLLKTMLGSGIMSLPCLFATYGIAPAMILAMQCAFFSMVGLYIFVLCSHRVGRKSSMSVLATECVPRMRIVVDIAVFVKCLGVATSYLIIARQLLPQIVGVFFAKPNPNIALAVFVCCIGPISFFGKLEKLRYTSFCGLVGILFILLASVFRYATTADTAYKTGMVSTYSTRWLGGLGKFVFAFTCHMNIFAVYNEADDNSPPEMRRLVLQVVLTAFLTYITFGYFNYALYGVNIHDNVLENYPDDYLAFAVRVFYVLVMAFSYPLQVNPCRLYFLNLVHVTDKRKVTYRILSAIITAVIIFITAQTAMRNVSLGLVYTIVGSTASTLMCAILPPLFYLNMGMKKSSVLVVLSYILFCWGIFVFATSFLGMLFKWN